MWFPKNVLNRNRVILYKFITNFHVHRCHTIHLFTCKATNISCVVIGWEDWVTWPDLANDCTESASSFCALNKLFSLQHQNNHDLKTNIFFTFFEMCMFWIEFFDSVSSIQLKYFYMISIIHRLIISILLPQT